MGKTTSAGDSPQVCIGVENDNNDTANTSLQDNTWGLEMEAYIRGLVETLVVGTQPDGEAFPDDPSWERMVEDTVDGT